MSQPENEFQLCGVGPGPSGWGTGLTDRELLGGGGGLAGDGEGALGVNSQPGVCG